MILVEKLPTNREAEELSRRLTDDEDSSSYFDDDFNEDDDEEGNNRDFFSHLPGLNLPGLPGLNYLNQLNLNINLNLRNTALWKMYESANFPNLPRPPIGIGNFLQNYRILNRQHDDLELDEHLEHDVSKGYFANFMGHYHTTQEDRQKLIKDAQKLINDDSDDDEDCSTDSRNDTDINDDFWIKLSKLDENSESIKPPLHPFYNHIELTLYDKIKIWVLTFTIFPIRCVGFSLSLVLAWLLAQIGTAFLSFEDSQRGPLAKWRRAIRWVIANLVMRMLFFFCGFQWVKVKGKQAKREEAPILVVSPHSTFWDAFPLILMGAPSVVAKMETRSTPFFGKLIDFTQPVYVTRENRESRQNSAMEIATRSQSDLEWPQVFVFPEGTCSNRSALISFKPGAFLPGVAVQPVVIRYPNRLDTVTWTFAGTSAIHCIWHTMTQFHNYIELEFLPVYVPNEEEKKDVKLFTNNVREVMAKSCGISGAEYGFSDGLVVDQCNKKCLTDKLKNTWRLRRALNLQGILKETEIVRESIENNWNLKDWLKSQSQFEDMLSLVDFKEELKRNEPSSIEKLFQVFKPDDNGYIDLREYIFFTYLLIPAVRVETMLPILFLMYGNNKIKRIEQDNFLTLLEKVFELKPEQAIECVTGGPTLDSSTTSSLTLDVFTQKMRRRLELMKLMSLEIAGELRDYPSRDVELAAAARTSVASVPKCKMN